METTMKRFFLLAALALGMQPAYSFCGFYVAKADAKLFNTTTQVIIARSGQHSTITMSSDFKGDVKDFAMVVPVPKVLQRDDIRVVERVLFDKLDAYSGPRLVEYWDENPCYTRMMDAISMNMVPQAAEKSSKREMAFAEDEIKTVRIEAKYTVGEYDILILSAEESGGLERWLLRNGYKIPEGARDVLEPYIKSNMKFFVVKVNIEELDKSGSQLLRPLQVSFDSPKFMLPIRLGMANSHGKQDMIVYLLTPNGRVETVNYRTVKIPSDRQIPEFIKEDFGDFYVDVYKTACKREGSNNIFLEYAWNVSGNAGVKCDPCTGTPPVITDLQEAGASWLSANGNWNGMTGRAFFTRLHVTYDREHFPQDLVFQETPNRENFQARYIITHAATGPLKCEEAKNYLANLKQRRTLELRELASLTGRDIGKYYEYLNKVQGYVPGEESDPIPLPEITPEKIKRVTQPKLAVVPDTITESQAEEAVVPVTGDSGNIDQAKFINDETDNQPVQEAGRSNSYLVLSASILISALLLLLRSRRT